MTTKTSTETFAIETINRADGSVDGHAAGCRDIARICSKEHADRSGAVEVATKHDAWLDYNSDFLAEGSGAYEINWAPCAVHVPQGKPDSELAWEAEHGQPAVPVATEPEPERITKAAAWESMRSVRANVRAMYEALDANDWTAFDKWSRFLDEDRALVAAYVAQQKRG